MYLSGTAAMASIDPWRLWQGKIRPAFPQRIPLGTGEEEEVEEEEEEEDSSQVDGLRLGKEGMKGSLGPHTVIKTSFFYFCNLFLSC